MTPQEIQELIDTTGDALLRVEALLDTCHANLDAANIAAATPAQQAYEVRYDAREEIYKKEVQA